MAKSTPNDPKVVKALKLIESGKRTIRAAVRETGANRSTVRHHLRQRGWTAQKPKKSKTVKKSTEMVVESNAIQHHLIESADGQRSLTVFVPSEAPVIVAGDHPKFDDILEEASSEAPNVDRLRELADTTVLVSTKFEALTERVTTRNGRIYFDGDELDTSLTQKILEMLDEGDNRWEPFVNFLENLYQNPSEHARRSFYEWLRSRPFGLTLDGEVIGYKGLERADADEDNLELDYEFESWHNGPAIVNGEEYDPESGTGVPQSIGDVVEYPRSKVDDNSRVACSDGLHVGTEEFASGYGDVVVRVIVNPRDVVGVPTNAGASTEKFRCCRYVIDTRVPESVKTNV